MTKFATRVSIEITGTQRLIHVHPEDRVESGYDDHHREAQNVWLRAEAKAGRKGSWSFTPDDDDFLQVDLGHPPSDARKPGGGNTGDLLG